MTDLPIHHIELREAVLHERLCHIQGVQLPFCLALTPGKVNLGHDICSYTTLSREQALVSRAKVNFKRFMRVYVNRWRSKGIIIDLAISLAAPMGKQRVMLSSLPAWHARRLEFEFELIAPPYELYPGCPDINIFHENFDPYVYAGRDIYNIFEEPNNEA